MTIYEVETTWVFSNSAEAEVHDEQISFVKRLQQFGQTFKHHLYHFFNALQTLLSLFYLSFVPKAITANM